MKIIVRNTAKQTCPSGSTWKWQMEVWQAPSSLSPKQHYGIKTEKLRKVSIDVHGGGSAAVVLPCIHVLTKRQPSKKKGRRKGGDGTVVFASSVFSEHKDTASFEVKVELVWWMDDPPGEHHDRAMQKRQHTTTLVHPVVLDQDTPQAFYESHHEITFPMSSGATTDNTYEDDSEKGRNASATTEPQTSSATTRRQDYLATLSQHGFLPRPKPNRFPPLFWHGRLGTLATAHKTTQRQEQQQQQTQFHEDDTALLLKPPLAMWSSKEAPRDDHGNNGLHWLTATEYHDTDLATIEWKLDTLANLLHQSRKTVLYTGAGISCAAGIEQAARGSNDDVSNVEKAVEEDHANLAAQPTFTHHALTAMWRSGFIHGWIQQNHDGLPQKAGFPQECINEVHGSWYDPANPVVAFSGDLKRTENEWMLQDAKTADLVLALGTSLSGMDADQVVTTAACRSGKGQSLGMAIINLQQTPEDDKASLRIFGETDAVLVDLLRRLSIDPLPSPLPTFQQRVSAVHRRVLVPYDFRGNRIEGRRIVTGNGQPRRRMWWDLRPGAVVLITEGHNLRGCDQEEYKGILVAQHRPWGTVSYWNEGTCSIELQFGSMRMDLGQWWLEAAIRGGPAQLPLVNHNPQYE